MIASFNPPSTIENGLPHAALAAGCALGHEALLAMERRRTGLSLWESGRLAEAAEALSAAAGFAPNDACVLRELGSVLWAAGRHADALQPLARAVEIDPRHLQGWLTLASVAHTAGHKIAAEHAFLAALDLAPACVDAATGLAFLHFEQKRYAEAAKGFEAVVASGSAPPHLWACLGQTRRLLGEFAAAREAFELAARAAPQEASFVEKYARARFIETAIFAPVDAAIEAYREAAGNAADDIEAVCRDAFQCLAGFGHLAGAARLAEALLAGAPDDPIIAWHLDALNGVHRERAPDAYLAACFDKYAAKFERHLVETLGYDIPAQCNALLLQTGRRFANILDLGCGTGLVAPHLAALGGALTGVDLSAGMLERARARGRYHRLFQAEATAHLSSQEDFYDLIVALDVLIYFGDLATVFDLVSSRLAPGGIFAFSYEFGSGRDYSFLKTGRFAHDPEYIERLSRGRFDYLADIVTTVRLEANAPLEGRLVLLRRV
ncbi:MAG: methyltransferase domain-containing protein [Methylocystis sp.]|uniref:class I SAM-dependent DNA methyltransferase n=1 Tax=Methylocystis sp. TaxID=1911079 RepID=UPI003DA2E26F